MVFYKTSITKMHGTMEKKKKKKKERKEKKRYRGSNFNTVAVKREGFEVSVSFTLCIFLFSLGHFMCGILNL